MGGLYSAKVHAIFSRQSRLQIYVFKDNQTSQNFSEENSLSRQLNIIHANDELLTQINSTAIA